MKKQIMLLSTALLVSGAALSACASSSASQEGPVARTDAAPAAPVLTSDIVYGSGATASGEVPLKLDLHAPAAKCSAPRPTIVYLHGGGFESGAKYGGYVPEMAQAAAEEGMNFVSIQYRLAGTMPVTSVEFAAFAADQWRVATLFEEPRFKGFVAAVEDTVRALRWMEREGAAHCIDVNRIALSGSSAGALAVLTVGYALDDYGIKRPQPRAVVDFWGRMLRYDVVEAGEPALMIVHGSEDGTHGDAVKLAAHAKAIKLPYSFYSITGGGHGFGPSGFPRISVEGQPMLKRVTAFVAANLRGEPARLEERRVQFVPE